MITNCFICCARITTPLADYNAKNLMQFYKQLNAIVMFYTIH